jgi:anthraniloyl-CoA monooxygenase
MYSATDGTPDDFHLVHYGSRATGGAGLVFTEMTCVSPEARITRAAPGCGTTSRRPRGSASSTSCTSAGDTKIALQLGHAGRKGATKLAWEGADQPLPSGGWPLIAPSPLPYLPGTSQVPRTMTRADMDAVLAPTSPRPSAPRAAASICSSCTAPTATCCRRSCRRSPTSAPTRTAAASRAAASFPLEVFAAMRAAWPSDRPMSVRLSAHDWAPGRQHRRRRGRDRAALPGRGRRHRPRVVGAGGQARAPGLRAHVPGAVLRSDPQRAGVPTIAVGNIFEADHVNTIIAAGRADLCALARPHLADPYWTLHAAAEQGVTDVPWPVQYGAGKQQLERNLARATQLALNA